MFAQGGGKNVGIFHRIMGFFGLQEEVEEIYEERQDDYSEQSPHQRRIKGNVVNLHTLKNVKVCLCEPRSYEDAQEIADHLRNHRTVVVNLQRMSKEQSLRIIDFLGGTIYALDGSIQKLGPNIFIFAPENVELEGSISDTFFEVME